jgi:hypothetical protein
MNDFASYRIGQDDPQPEAQAPTQSGPVVREHTGASRIVLNGSSVDEAVLTDRIGRTSELNPYHGTDSILATAKHPTGLPVTEIVGTTLIEVNGLQAPASFWATQGLLQKDADGTYSEATTQPAPAPQAADTSEIQPLGKVCKTGPRLA